MNIFPFVKKDDNALPDSYGITIYFIDGKNESFDVASHAVVPNSQYLSFVTRDDLWQIVPLSAIKRIEFDKQFSKIVAIKEKLSKK